MKTITSLTHHEVKRLCALRDSAKERSQQHACCVEGFRSLSLFSTSAYPLEMVYTTESQLHNALTLFPQEKVTLVSDAVMKKTSSAQQPSGILGVFSTKQVDAPHLTHGIVLAHIADPGNMGTIIRTAVALNIPSIVLIEGCDPFNPKVLQSSAGTLAHAPLITLSWNEFIQKTQVPVYALVVEGGKRPQELSLQKSFLVVGNEAHGLPQEYKDTCTDSITLPMPGNAESLNAAIAASIAMYVATCYAL